MKEIILSVKYEQTPTTMAQSLYAFVQHTDKADLTLSEVMGYSSHAFRINLRAKSIEMDSVYSAQGTLIARSLFALGFQPIMLNPKVSAITPQILQELVVLIRDRLQQGFPIIGWDLLAKEFGIIYGFDDSTGVFFVRDSTSEGVIPYSELHKRRILCLGTIEGSLATNKTTMLKHALEAIIEHAHSRDELSFPNVQSGLQAYEAWIEALTSADKISNKGNAFNLHIIADARRHAVRFLEGIARERGESEAAGHGAIITRLANQAAAHYAQVAERLAEMETLYPYPLNKNSTNPRLKDDNNLRSIEILRAARAEEAKGITVLQEMQTALQA